MSGTAGSGGVTLDDPILNRDILNSQCERTAPARLYWAGHVEEPRPVSPTDGEGFYPDTQKAETA